MAKTTSYHGASAPRILPMALTLAAALWLTPEAKAQCVQSGNDVQCTGTDPDGFESIISGITLTVQPDAAVQNDGTDPSISLESTSQATVEAGGAITAVGDSTQGIRGDSENSLTNRGSVIISGAQTTGVALGPLSDLLNEATGRILASPGLLGGGSVAAQVGSGGSLTNEGLIQSAGDGSAGVVALSFGTLINSGNIIAQGAEAKGVILGASSNLDNSGTLTATGMDAVGVRFDGFASATNSGVIEGGDGEGAAVLVETTLDTSLTNTAGGSISATSGIAIQGDAGRSVIQNSGSIEGDVLLEGGFDEFRWGSDSTLTGALSGGGGTDELRLFQPDPENPTQDSFDLGRATAFETLTIGNPGDTGTWTLTGSGSYSEGIFIVDGVTQFSDSMTLDDAVRVEGGTARLGDDVNFASGINVDGGRAVFESGNRTTADFIVGSGGTTTAEGSSTLEGDLSFHNGSRYEVGFDATSHSQIDVTGTIGIEENATLAVIQQDTTPLQQTLRVLTATETFAGQFDDLSGGSAFLQVTNPIYGSAGGLNFLDVDVLATFTAPAQTPNQLAVGHFLDIASQGGPSFNFDEFLTALQALTEASTGSQALEALHPEFYDAHTSASFQTGSTYARMIARRPHRCERLVAPDRKNRPSLEPCSEQGWTPWSDGFGRYTIRRGNDDFEDWSYGGGGIAFGVDHDLAKNVLLTAMLGTSRMALDFDGEGDASITTFDLGLGGAWRHGQTHVRGVVEYGHGWHRTRRHIQIPEFERMTRADHTSNRVTGLLEAGHAFLFQPFSIEPMASVEYTFLHEEAISESHAGVIGLDVDARSNALLALRTGFRAGATLVKWSYTSAWLEWADGIWRPEITATWVQLFGDYNRTLTARLGGAPADTPDFRTRAQDAQWGADLGARVSFQPRGSRNSVELGYQVFLGDGNLSQAVLLRFRMPF